MSDNTTINILGQSRDTLSFLKEMGLHHLPLSPKIEDFLAGKSDAVAGNAKETSEVRTEPSSRPCSPLNTIITENKNPVLGEIAADLDGCTRCPLHKSRALIVTGQGKKTARLFIIEEKPTAAEELSKQSVAGAAGELFDKMLQAIGLERGDVFITSIVKCRPENDRPPTDKEINTCLPFLIRQIAAVKPDVIYTLGPLAAKVITGSNQPLFRLRGRFHDFHGAPVMPSFHPSFLLKNEEMKKASWIDLQLIRKKLSKKT